MDRDVQRQTELDPESADAGQPAPLSGSERDAGTPSPAPSTSIPDARGASSATPTPTSVTPEPATVTPAPTLPEPAVVPSEPLNPTHEVCNPMGYCWAQPQPFGDRIIELHGSANGSTLFAVSAVGALLGRSGEVWRYHDFGPDVWVQTVHVVADNQVWAGTSDGAYQWLDGRWTRMRGGSVRALATDASGDLWMVTGGQVLRWDSKQWHDETPGEAGEASFIDVATNDDGVWLLATESIGRKTRCFPYQLVSESWRELPGPQEEYSIAGQNAGLLVAGGDVYLNCNHQNESGEFFGRVGETWEPIAGLGGPSFAASDGTLFSGHAVWHPEQGFVGTLNVSPTAVWGSSSGNVWVGLPDGGVARLGGTRFEVETVPRQWSAADWDTTPPEVWANATSAWGTAANDVWRTPVEHYDGQAWTRVSEALARSIHGSATDNVWFALQSTTEPPYADSSDVARVAQWDGETLRELELPEDWTGFALTAILTFGPDDVWVAGSKYGGSARIARYDGTTWRTVHEEEAAVDYYAGFFGYWRSIQGTSSSDVWALSGNRLVRFVREHTEVYTPESVGTAGFAALSVADDEVFVLTVDGIQIITPDSISEPRRFGYEYMDRLALRGDRLWIYDELGRALYGAR